jgi:hypothetical protein
MGVFLIMMKDPLEEKGGGGGAGGGGAPKGRRVVVALYPFKAIENGDLSLEKVEKNLTFEIREGLIIKSH